MGNNRKRNTKLWLVSWAVLFLIVVYSPIGRPDLYVGTTYTLYNQNVSFKDGIDNAISEKTFSEDLNADVNTPTYSPVGSANGEFEGNASRFSKNSSFATAYNDVSRYNDYGAGYGSAIMAMRSGRNSAQGASTAQNNNVNSLSSDLAMTGTATNRQADGEIRPDGGGTDPGGDPTGDRIPVGDGIYLLLLMAGIYTIWKMKISSFFLK